MLVQWVRGLGFSGLGFSGQSGPLFERIGRPSARNHVLKQYPAHKTYLENQCTLRKRVDLYYYAGRLLQV